MGLETFVTHREARCGKIGSSMKIESTPRRVLTSGHPFRSAAMAMVLFAPAWVSTLYLNFFASPQYASEATFVVRTSSRASSPAGLSSLFAAVGIAQPHDQAFTVQDFMLSRDAVSLLQERINLRAAYAGSATDPFYGFPSWINGNSFEHLWRHYRRLTEVVFHANTGITSLRVKAFDPEVARAIARELMAIGEQTVNGINRRLFEDGVRMAQLEVTRAEGRVTAAQAALSGFRGRELTLDPGRSSILVTDLIGRLGSELAATQAQIAEMRATSPNNPALANAAARADALRLQIAEERLRGSGGPDGLARQLGEYDRLNLEREFANRLLVGALQALQSARVEAQRQQLFLERVTEPLVADYASFPETLRWSVTITALNSIAVMIGWLIFVGAREHKRGLQLRIRT